MWQIDESAYAIYRVKKSYKFSGFQPTTTCYSTYLLYTIIDVERIKISACGVSYATAYSLRSFIELNHHHQTLLLLLLNNKNQNNIYYYVYVYIFACPAGSFR